MALPFQIFHGRDRQERSLHPNTSLAELRNQLGSFMTAEDVFTYYDARQKKQYTLFEDLEQELKLSEIADQQNCVTIVNTKAHLPDLQAQAIPFFRDRGLQATFVLDNGDALKKEINQDRMRPLMLEHVQSIKEAAGSCPNVFWDHAVICEADAVVQLNYSCPGATSFEVHSGFEGPGDQIVENAQNNAPENHLDFVVKDYADLSLDFEQRLTYSALSITAFQEPGQPQNKGLNDPELRLDPSEIEKVGAFPKTLLIPGQSILSAVPQPRYDHSFIHQNSRITNENTRKVLGTLTIYFLVVKSKDDARQIQKQVQ